MEPSFGVERLLYNIIYEAFSNQKIDNDNYLEVLRLNYELCPYKVAFLPLSISLIGKAKEIYPQILKTNISAIFAISCAKVKLTKIRCDRYL